MGKMRKTKFMSQTFNLKHLTWMPLQTGLTGPDEHTVACMFKGVFEILSACLTCKPFLNHYHAT